MSADFLERQWHGEIFKICKARKLTSSNLPESRVVKTQVIARRND
jgi:hypothetical protein